MVRGRYEARRGRRQERRRFRGRDPVAQRDGSKQLKNLREEESANRPAAAARPGLRTPDDPGVNYCWH